MPAILEARAEAYHATLFGGLSKSMNDRKPILRSQVTEISALKKERHVSPERRGDFVH